MFAAASGARLAHRHNKTVKKQIGLSQIEGYQANYKALQRQQQLRYSDVHGLRYSGIPQKRLAYSSKLYSSNYNPGLKLSTSYIDINGRISKLGQYDFEGKAAWQDRELSQEISRRESACIPSEVHTTSKFRQKEAHRRWVKRNRIQDLTLGDPNSDEEDLLYGVQNSAANLLLYVGLGTMCIGMIIAFVGTGEKGFKTMELRLIGPSLICAGVLIIILRVMLCVCPSKCLQLKKEKHKLKNSTNKLNSEGNRGSQSVNTSKEQMSEQLPALKPFKACDNKKRVSIATLPTTSGRNTNTSTSHSHILKTPKLPLHSETVKPITTSTISFTEHEKPSSSKSWNRKTLKTSKFREDGKSEQKGEVEFEMKEFNENNFESTSFGSQSSCARNFFNLPDPIVFPDTSDASVACTTNGMTIEIPQSQTYQKTSASKFEISRNPKNLPINELVLSPLSLNESKGD